MLLFCEARCHLPGSLPAPCVSHPAASKARPEFLLQAERGRREAEAQLSATRQQAAALAADNSDLQQQLAGAQRQMRKLERLQPFQEQQRGDQAAALAHATARMQQLEERCAELEAELAGLAVAAALPLQCSGEQTGASSRPQDEQQQHGCDSLSTSDLCDLHGAVSHFVGAAMCSPQQGAQSGAAGGLPSRRRVLQQRQAGQQAKVQERDQGEWPKQHGIPAQRKPLAQHEAAVAAAVSIAEREAHESNSGSLVESLQQQLLEQQRQLAHVQGEQQTAMQGCSASAAQQAAAETCQSGRLEEMQGELAKLQRRNLQLQAALSECSLQHARAAAATQQQLQAAQQEAAALRAQRDEAQQQLAVLQAAAAVLAGDADEHEQLGGSRAGTGPTTDQLEELLEYVTRCNAAVEQNAGEHEQGPGGQGARRC